MIVSTRLNDGEVMLLVRNTITSSKKNQLFFAVSTELIGASSIADTPLRPSPVPPAKLRVPKPYMSFAVSAFCSTVMPARRVQSSAGQGSLPKYSSPPTTREKRASGWRAPRRFSPFVFSPDFVRVENIFTEANHVGRRCTV